MVHLDKAKFGLNVIMTFFGIFNVLITVCIIVDNIPFKSTLNNRNYNGLVLVCSENHLNYIKELCLIPLPIDGIQIPSREILTTGDTGVDNLRTAMRWINIALVGVIVISYVLPGVYHMCQIKILRFIKGVFYLIFLSPTYVIIFGIYSAANIHDVTWGSRPAGGAG